MVGLDATTLLRFLQRGFPLVGTFSAPGVYLEEEVGDAPISPKSPLETAPERWAEISRLVSREVNAGELWRQAMEEMSIGWVEPPTDFRPGVAES